MPLIDTTGIRPIERRQPTDDISRARRREEGTSSAFRPQTNVALKTAIQDLSATLSKISSEEKYGVQKLPKEISDVVKNILRQSLSIDSKRNRQYNREPTLFNGSAYAVFANAYTNGGTCRKKLFNAIER